MFLSEIHAANLGDRVRLSEPVRAVDQTGNLVRVRTDRATYDGSKFIALPPLLADTIEYRPGLLVARSSAVTARGGNRNSGPRSSPRRGVFPQLPNPIGYHVTYWVNRTTAAVATPPCSARETGSGGAAAGEGA